MAEDGRIIAVYGRVSDADKEAESSIPDQLREGTAFARRKWPGLPVQVFPEIGTAATIAKRPVFCQVIDLCGQGRVHALVVRDQDRLSRDAGEMIAFHKHVSGKGVEIWLYRAEQQLRTDSPTDKLMLTLLSGVSQFEREMCAARTKARMISMRNKGQWTGGHIPNGYSLGTVGGKKTLVPNDKADAVRRVFQTAADTHSMAEAYRVGLAEGLWTGKQGTLYALANRVYLGEWRTPQGVWIPNHHEPLVSKELFEMAQDIKRLPYNAQIRKHDRAFILEGLIHCEHCGCHMTNAHVKKPNGLRIFYYECTKRGSKCPVKRIPAGEMEDWVWERLAELCQDTKVLKAALDEFERSGAEVSPVDMAKLAVLDEQLKSAAEKQKTIKAYMDKFFSKGSFPPPSVSEDLIALESNMAALKREAEELRLKTSPPRKIKADEFLFALRQALNDGQASPKTKQGVVQSLVRQIVVSTKEIRVDLMDPSEASLPRELAVGEKFGRRTSMAPQPAPSNTRARLGEVWIRLVHDNTGLASPAPLGITITQLLLVTIGHVRAFQPTWIVNMSRSIAASAVINPVLPGRGSHTRRAKTVTARIPRPPAVAETICRARAWSELLKSGKVRNLAEIARREGLSRARVTQVMTLLRLPKAVLEQVLSTRTTRHGALGELSLRRSALLKNHAPILNAFREAALPYRAAGSH